MRSRARPGIVWDIRWIFNCICFIATYNIYLCFIGSPLNPINCEYNLAMECRQHQYSPLFGKTHLPLVVVIIISEYQSPVLVWLILIFGIQAVGCMRRERRWVSVLWHPGLPPRLWWTQTCCYDREQRISPGQLLSNGWWGQPTNRSLSHHLSDSPPV